MFLSNGDFIFPFDAIFYWLKHIFIWSFQAGATNLDGIIRLPGRLIYLIVFQIFGNVGVSYFFLISSLIIIFFAFYYFAKNYLKIENRSFLIILSLFFTFNPIFLGNIAKIGLIVAAAMLPLCLALLYRAFSTQKFSYLVLSLFALNISLIHPFTFTINFLVFLGYIIYLAKNHWQFVSTNIFKFLGVFIITILINVYFIFSIISLGTIDKSALSQDISDNPIDYTSLVAIANTGDIFTALSLSKNVLIDFAFYNEKNNIIYFTGTFLLYVLLIFLYIFVQKKINKNEKKQLIIWMSAFLALTVLSTATFFHVDLLIKFLISLPGGWMFRSPLKWQLYIPLAIGVILAILVRHLKKRSHTLTVNIFLVAIIVSTCLTLTHEIYTKLLTPRSVENFVTLQKTDMEMRNMLFISSDGCSTFARENSRVMTELNQVLISKNTQIKRVSIKDIDKISLHDYDYILSCKIENNDIKKFPTDLKYVENFVNKAFVLYENSNPDNHIYVINKLYSLEKEKNIKSKSDLTKQLFKQNFYFVNKEFYDEQAINLYDVYENITPRNINKNTLSSSVHYSPKDKQVLFIKEQKDPLYYNIISENHITFSPIQSKNFVPLKIKNGYGEIETNSTKKKQFVFDYIDSRFNYNNVIQNSSLENGLWRKKVGDCNAYDNQPIISIKLDQQNKTDGKQSLQLYAKHHIACTELPKKITVERGATYMLSFDYLSPEAYSAGYSVDFGENTSLLKETLPLSGKDWHTFNNKIEVPENSTSLKLNIYAFPDELIGKTAIVNYDNFKLIKIPKVQNSFYMLNYPKKHFNLPKKVEHKIINPTEKHIQVEDATTPFYIVMKDGFHPKWKLSLYDKRKNSFNSLPWITSPAIREEDHFNVNNGMNGWYIDPKLLCKQTEYGCVQNPNGSYNIQLVAEFTPQRWFELGLIISGTTIIGCIVYLLYDWRKHRSPKIALGKKSKL